MEETLKVVGTIAYGTFIGILLGYLRNSIWQSLDDDYHKRIRKGEKP